MRVFSSSDRDYLVTIRRLAALVVVLIGVVALIQWGPWVIGLSSEQKPQPVTSRSIPGQDTFEVSEHFAPKTQHEIEQNIREALFRHLFQEYASGRNTAYFFLAFKRKDSQDPPPSFFARFDGHDPPVEPVSKAETDPSTGEVFHSMDGRKGLIFYAGEVHWLNASTVEIEGSYYAANQGAGGTTYRLTLQEREWVVERAPGAAVWFS